MRFVRLTLLGEYRTLWLDGHCAPLWRSHRRAAAPRCPPPPPVAARASACRPRRPTRRRLPPRTTCHVYARIVAFGDAYPVAFKEPCGLTPAACCTLAYDHNHTAAWHLSPSGCCTLLEVPEADHAGLKAGSAPTIDGQTTRPVVEWSGARKALIGEFF